MGVAHLCPAIIAREADTIVYHSAAWDGFFFFRCEIAERYCSAAKLA